MVEMILTAEDGTKRAVESGRRLLAGTGVADNEMRLRSRSASRLHALIDVREDVCRIADLGSRYGTRLNGQWLPIGQYVALKDGDEVAFGDERFRFARKEGIMRHYEEDIPDHDRAYRGQHPFVHYM